MTSARYPLPTDLVALVSFDGRVYPNEAKPWDRLGLSERGPHPLETALEQWFSFATGKHTWVSVRGATIRGLISARRRAKRSAWEVDVLIDADEDKSVALSLLTRMARGVGKLGAERVFLRLSAESHLVDVARQAAFFPYGKETLYGSEDAGTPEAPDLSLRPVARADDLGLFHLYRQAAPAGVRAIEGATFREWQAAQEPWHGRPADLVLEEQGLITAWLRLLPGRPGRLALVARSRQYDHEALLRAAIASLSACRPLLCLAPDYDAPLADALRRLGFGPAGQYVTLAKRLLKPTQELAPEKVGTAVPVS
ncbi:MAG TPA: hypothetical protein VFT91_05170 [Dehalococcoidia bacterium]|nr:hypothetical protein [Dehalococcoidia bacterium]